MRDTKSARRRAITLIELMVVISLIAMVTGLFTVNIQRWIRQERFRSSVATVKDALNVAQDLMLVVGADNRVHLHRENGQWVCDLEAIDALPNQLDRLIKSRRILEGIQDVRFQDRDEQWLVEDIVLPFMSQGGWMPRGSLELSGYGDIRQIQLSGFPQRVGRRGVGNTEQRRVRSEEFYPALVAEEATGPAA